MIISLALNIFAIIFLVIVALFAIAWGSQILVFIFELIDYKEVKDTEEETK